MTLPESTVFLTLGSNIDPETNLKAALRLLRQHGPVLALSPVYQSAPQGDENQPDFLNMAVQVSTSLSPARFKQHVIGHIEAVLERVRDPNNKNAARTIDVDIALWDHESLEFGSKPWHIPDPDLMRYAHIAIPLADLAPEYIHPENGLTLAEIAASLVSSTLRRVNLDFELF